jgi:large subunit ribosomal protein L2
MQFKKKVSTTPGVRQLILIKKSLLVKKNNLIKSLIKGVKLNSGKSTSTGKTTVFHRSTGHKKSKHIFGSSNTYFSICISHMYNCNQNAFLSLNFDLINKKFFKSGSVLNNFPGGILISGDTLDETYIGYRTKLKSISIGSTLNNVKFNNLKYSRSAGTFITLLERKKLCTLRLPSGRLVKINENAFATFGVSSNPGAKHCNLGKAGRSRNLGIRPTVRGVAMNPVDHPHGGKTNGGRACATPWGLPTRGKPTVKIKKWEELNGK